MAGEEQQQNDSSTTTKTEGTTKAVSKFAVQRRPRQRGF
jgi:hypothetical protein